jgi:hypothetical protein
MSLIMINLVVLNEKTKTSPTGCTRLSFMAAKITKIGQTSDKISARGGLPLFLRYVEQIGLYSMISGVILPHILQTNKGLQLQSFLKQIIAFFIDGSNMAISGFDQSKKDESYASLLECAPKQLASSHQIKRYFHKLSFINNMIFNYILHELFIWRLKMAEPKVIELGIDTMVLDNDDAKKRQGCEVTYKNKKGFQPLHISWKMFLIDVFFRKGSAHSNHGNDYIERVDEIVKLIRRRYSAHVPIILCGDSGFCDEKAFKVFEDDLNIHYITTGKLYPNIKEHLHGVDLESGGTIEKGKAIWKFVEFGNRLGSWKKFRSCIFTHLDRDHDGQYVMNFDKPDSVIYTNIGNCPKADQMLRDAGCDHYFEASFIVKRSHQRGADELIHRSLKELATKEQLPFKTFGMNRAYYFLLVITHFLFETCKQDVTAQVIPSSVYPETFRRKLIDFAVKIVSHARQTTLKVTTSVYKSININALWKLCQSPPRIQYT